MHEFFNNVMKWVEDNPELSIIIGFIIGTVGVVLTIIFGIVPLIQNRKKKTKEKSPTEKSPPDYYKFIWKYAEELTPEDVLGLRGKGKYGYKEYYYKRDFHNELIKRIRDGKDAIVVGMSLSGKTRMVYQAFRSLGNGYSVTLLEKLELEKSDLRVPPIKWWRSKKKRVLVIDDINNFIGNQNFILLLNRFMADGVTVVATCRTGPELIGYKGTDLPTYFQKPIEITKLEEDDLNKISKRIKIKPPDGFDWNIGSLFLPLTIMNARYSELKREEKRVLKTINRLHFGGVFDIKGVFTIDRVKRYYEEKNSIKIDEGEFNSFLEDLSEKEFLEFGGNTVKVEEAYLEKVIEGGKPTPEDFSEMTHIFINDPDALFKLGIRSYEIGIFEKRLNDYMNVSIKANNNLLKLWTIEKDRYKYATVKNNIGIAFSGLAKFDKPIENIKKSIEIFKEVLKIHLKKDFPKDYAMTNNNLGISYCELSNYDKTKENLKKSIKAYEEALKVYTIDEFPIYYATIQNNLGISYDKLSRIDYIAENLNGAIVAYEEALKVYTIEDFPEYYAMAQNNIGVSYRKLSKIEKPEKNINNSIKAFKKALKVYTINKFPRQYAMTQNNLGNVYTNLSRIENPRNNLKKSIKTFKEALRVRTIDELPIEYAQTQNNLGISYTDLARIENTDKNVDRSIYAFKEALKIRTLEAFPMQYAMTKGNIGNLYLFIVTLGDVDKEKNCKIARSAYNESLEVFKRMGITQDIEDAERRIEELNKICSEGEKGHGGD